MRTLARPTDTLEAHYDAVVIGSGYGAGIAASRLSRMGLTVCVLERGREFLPGQFPSTLRQGMAEFQADTPLGRTGSELGLFDLRVNDDISVMVGCGLGGTSLINGNVMLKPEARVFEDTVWPEPFRAELATTVAEGYARAARMLQPVSYPGPDLAKLAAFRTAAGALGAECTLPPINVTFEPRPRRQSRRRSSTGLHVMRRLLLGLQCRRQEHGRHELPARCGGARRGRFHPVQRTACGAGGRRLEGGLRRARWRGRRGRAYGFGPDRRAGRGHARLV